LFVRKDSKIQYENLSEDREAPGREFNSAPTEYVTEFLTKSMETSGVYLMLEEIVFCIILRQIS
jgi:hypothetical protein